MTSRIGLSCSSRRHSALGRPLVLLFLCLSLLLVIAPPAASQGDDVGGELPTQQREWATLDVTVDAKDSLSAEVGRQATIPITITNNGNIAAVGVIAVIEGGDFLVGTPVKVGDLPPGASAAVALPIDIKGRTASPLPITARVAADNVPYPVLVPIAQTFTGLGTGNYLSVALDADLLLEQQYDRYDGGFARPQPLLWFESRDKAAETILTVNLKSLLAGKPPRDLVLSVLFYADGKEIPEPVEAGYDPEQLSLTFAPAGEGRYLIEWSRPMPQTGAAGDGTEGMVESAAAANVEPDLPQGWTPTYHAPLVSEFNGSVTINYPILTPPGAAGLQPNLGLSYSSANGNGMIGRLQADDAGFGWNNVAAIDVTQALVICHGSNVCEAHFDPDGDPDTNNSYNQYTLSFNGAGHELIHAGGIANNGAPGRYYARGHAGLYVELCKAPFSAYCIFSGTNIDTMSDVFWRIKSADNTTYRLGFTTNSEQEIINAAAAGVDNKALRWRVDTITDRFGNTMTYTYDEYTYNGWIHPEYFHASASYPKQITYDAYKVVFTYEEVPYDAYRTQGYGHVVSWQTHRLSQVFVKVAGSPDITVRTYQLGYDFQRYGTDNDTDNLPLDPSIANQSAWCSAFNWVLNFNDPNDKDDNIKYTPDKMPMLRTVRELGSDGNARSGLKDAEFTYSFLGTGEYDHPNASAHVRYCFPYLTSVETLYGPAAANTPTTAYTWRAAQQAFQTAGSLPHLVVGRYVNLVEQETTYSGFVADAPTQNVHFQYTTPNMQGDKDTFQGFNTVERCRDASCSGSWAARETMTFLTNPYYADNAALTGRLQQSDTRGYPNTLIARTENTWSMLEGDGIPGADPSRAAVLMKQIRRDYRGGTIAARTDYVYDLYGNQTQTQEFGERTGTPPWRTLERAYTVNTNVGNDKWLVNLAWRETLWDGPSNGATDKIVRQTRFRYDGAACNAPNTTPTLGRLTAMDAYVPGFGISCGGTDYNTTTYTYDATRKWQVTRVTDAVGRYKDYNWTDATRLGSVTDSVGTTNYAYNTLAIDPGFRWQIRDVTQPNGATTRYSYDVHGRLQQINAPDPATAGAIGAAVKDYNYDDTATPFVIDEIIPVMSSNSTRTFYDAVGRPLQTRQFYVSGDFNTIVTDMEYDSFGRTRCATAALHSTQKVNFDTALDCDAQPKKVYTYDVLGETLSETGYDGTTTTTAVVGRERRVTDAAGNQFIYASDELGRLLRVRQPVTAAPNWTMSYTYDLADNLLTATGPNNIVTTMTYDRLGRKLTMNDPDMGIWSYDYDGSGNLKRQTDQNGKRLCFYYDAANRPTSKRHDGTGNSPCPAMWGGTLLANYTYHTGGAGKGMPASIGGGSGVGAFTDTFSYDFRGRVTSQTRVIGGKSFSLSTTYDDVDRPLIVTTPTGQLITYSYEGEFAKTVHAGGQGLLVEDLDYNYRRQLTGIERAGSLPDTILAYYGEAEAFRLDEIQHGTTGDAIPDFLYNQYDNLGHLEIVQMRQSGVTETQTFGYDAVSRLTSAVGTGAAAYDYAYTYGPDGNLATRVNRTPSSHLTRAYVYDTDDTPNDGRHYHALESVIGDGLTATFVNDPNGNMTTRTVNTTTYTQAFDVENRLTSVTVGGQTTTFHYDADGNRTLTVQPNGTKVYTPFPDFEESVPVNGATTQRSSYFLAGQLIAVQVRTGSTGNGTLYLAFADHLGTIAAWANASGALISGSLARYEPYGGYRTTPATTVNPGISDRGFTGHRMNNTGSYGFGLIYMNARYYLPEIGRFISADSIEPDPQNPQSYNRYSYTRNNPVNFTDPTGHRECEIICDGESQNWRTYQDSAWLEGWDVKQQAANAATAETVLVDVPQAIVGAFWEPADWVLALRDGFQWNDSFGMLPFVPATVGRYADEGVSALRAARPKAFDIVPYRPTNSAHDLVNHHGILDVWASANIPGYLSRKGDAPTIALTVEQHKATISEYWNWIRENAFGRGPNLAEVLPQQIQELSLRMFDAAGVPPSVQDTYFRVFNQYIYTGTWQR